MHSLGRFGLVTGLAAGLLVFSANPARPQQGSVQISTAVQTIQGDTQRLAGQKRLEPDMAVTWLQPGSRFGVFQIEIRGARRGEELHTGRMYGSLRDAKYRGVTWTIEAGDTYFSPDIGEYRFANLFTPAVTFNGVAATGRTARSSVSVVAGKTTAWRSIFGNDPQALGQSLAIARMTHRPTTGLELSARGSRVRTSSLREFSYTIDAGDQVGGGARLALTSTLQVVADGSLVSYRRTGALSRERDGSYMGGVNWLHSRGWLQVNASRFSPGDFPSLNNPLQDRKGLFAAGEYDLSSRTRVSGGWERFRSNLKPEASLASARPTPESSGSRGFGGMRVQVTQKSAITLRGERGERESHAVGAGFPSDSDTGVWAAEWQAAIGRTNTFVRYSVRENVEHVNQSGSYDQRDGSAQLFANVTRNTQVFGTGMITRTEMASGGGNTYWQVGGGTQLRVRHHDLWLRAEGTAARNLDLLTRNFVPRESLGFGLNGQMSRETTIALNVNMDRAQFPSMEGSPWVTRSMLRVSHRLSTGSVYMANSLGVAGAERGRGTGTVSGSVFADWNANGIADPGENPLESIPLRLGAGHSTTGRDGQFAFVNVPAGMREIGIDTSALPIDFDPPAVAQIQIDLSRGDTKRVSFGLVPLGSIHGRVTRDANGNGKADPNEEPIDGAIVILDGGVRSEQARKGRYRFEAVRSGAHLVKLLIDSLPEGALIAGESEVPATLARDSMAADVSFVVSVEKRPEIRKVFPPRGGTAATAAGRPVPGRVASPVATRPDAAGRGTPASRSPALAPRTAAPRNDGGAAGNEAESFAIQIAALSDPVRARAMVRQLTGTGLPAYLVSPPAADPDAPYRVRVGPYASRAAARKTAAALEGTRGKKVWVTKEN
jgi:cell division septation protein DedD